MTIKERLPIHRRAYPYFLFTLGLLIGFGIATDWEIKTPTILIESFNINWETGKSAWDIIGAIGSILAGSGTFYLAYFARKTRREWVNKAHEEKRLEQKIDIVSEINKEAWKIHSFLTRQFIIDKGDFKYLDYMEIISKLRMQIDLFSAFDDVQESQYSDIEDKLESSIEAIGELHLNSNPLSFSREQKYRKARRSVDKLVIATQDIHLKVLKELRKI